MSVDGGAGVSVMASVNGTTIAVAVSVRGMVVVRVNVVIGTISVVKGGKVSGTGVEILPPVIAKPRISNIINAPSMKTKTSAMSFRFCLCVGYGLFGV